MALSDLYVETGQDAEAVRYLLPPPLPVLGLCAIMMAFSIAVAASGVGELAAKGLLRQARFDPRPAGPRVKQVRPLRGGVSEAFASLCCRDRALSCMRP